MNQIKSNISTIFPYISLLSHLLPLIFFLAFSLKKELGILRVILVYSTYSFINDSIIFYYPPGDSRSQLVFVLLSLFTVAEYLLFSYLLYSLIRNNNLRKVIVYFSPFFIGFSIIQFIQAKSYNIDSISITVEYIAIIIFSLFYFFEELNTPNATFIYSTKEFWMVVGILIYSTGTFFFFLYADSISAELWDKYAIINHIFTIFKNVCFSIALTIKPDSENLNALETVENDYPETPLKPFNSNP